MSVRNEVLKQPTLDQARKVGTEAVKLGQLSQSWLDLALRAYLTGVRDQAGMDVWLARRKAGFKSGAARRARAQVKPVQRDRNAAQAGVRAASTAAVRQAGMVERGQVMADVWAK